MRKKVFEIIYFVSIILVSYLIIKYKVFYSSEILKSQQKEKEVENYVRDYMMEVVKDRWKEEMIKTMAVITRTCYVYNQYNASDINYITKRETEVSKDLKNRVYKAVEETKGEVLTYEDNIIYPYIHEVSPRVTRTKEKILDVQIPYLKRKKCYGDVEAKDFFQIKYFRKEDIIKELKEYDKNNIDKEYVKDELNSKNTSKKNMQDETEIVVTKVDEDGYVYGIEVEGTNIDAHRFAKILGLNSMNFTITPYLENEEIIRIVCLGKGSGFGLSIYDACSLADKGYSYEEIINEYYKKVVIKKEINIISE